MSYLILCLCAVAVLGCYSLMSGANKPKPVVQQKFIWQNPRTLKHETWVIADPALLQWTVVKAEC